MHYFHNKKMLKHILLSTNAMKYVILCLLYADMCKMKKHTHICSYYFSTTSLELSDFYNPIREKIIDGVPRSSLGLMCVSRVLSKLTHKLPELQAIIFWKVFRRVRGLRSKCNTDLSLFRAPKPMI